MKHLLLERWNTLSRRDFGAFCLGAAVFILLLLKSKGAYLFILDSANLMFHEAGHPLLGLFSSRLEVYGGTLGQLAFPVVLAVSFWRRREAVAFGAAVIWFFENWLGIARYMADARTQILPFVGGEIHDWGEIFGRWHVLALDTQIAAVVRTGGFLGMGATCLWVSAVWWAGRNASTLNALEATV